MLRYPIAYVAAGGVFSASTKSGLLEPWGFYRRSVGGLLAGKPNLTPVAITAFAAFAGFIAIGTPPHGESNPGTGTQRASTFRRQDKPCK